MTAKTLVLSRRIDELLATTDPFAVHESVTSYLASVEEPLLQRMLLSSVPNLDEQSGDVLRQELVDESNGATLEQAITEPRPPGQLASSVSRFLALEPRALASLAPPLLTGYLAHIAELQGDAPRKKLDTRVWAGVGAGMLGILLVLHLVGKPNGDEAPFTVVPLPTTMTGAFAPGYDNLPLRLRNSAGRRKLHPRGAHHWAGRPIMRHVRKPTGLAMVPPHHRRLHRKHYGGKGELVRRNGQSGRHSVALRRHIPRSRSATAHRIARKPRTTAWHNRTPHRTVFHGIFKPFHWVLFKPVHRGPG